jgi:hypothetical protein
MRTGSYNGIFTSIPREDVLNILEELIHHKTA